MSMDSVVFEDVMGSSSLAPLVVEYLRIGDIQRLCVCNKALHDLFSVSLSSSSSSDTAPQTALAAIVRWLRDVELLYCLQDSSNNRVLLQKMIQSMHPQNDPHQRYRIMAYNTGGGNSKPFQAKRTLSLSLESLLEELVLPASYRFASATTTKSAKDLLLPKDSYEDMFTIGNIPPQCCKTTVQEDDPVEVSEEDSGCNDEESYDSSDELSDGVGEFGSDDDDDDDDDDDQSTDQEDFYSNGGNGTKRKYEYYISRRTEARHYIPPPKKQRSLQCSSISCCENDTEARPRRLYYIRGKLFCGSCLDHSTHLKLMFCAEHNLGDCADWSLQERTYHPSESELWGLRNDEFWVRLYFSQPYEYAEVRFIGVGPRNCATNTQ